MSIDKFLLSPASAKEDCLNGCGCDLVETILLEDKFIVLTFLVLEFDFTIGEPFTEETTLGDGDLDVGLLEVIVLSEGDRDVAFLAGGENVVDDFFDERRVKGVFEVTVFEEVDLDVILVDCDISETISFVDCSATSSLGVSELVIVDGMLVILDETLEDKLDFDESLINDLVPDAGGRPASIFFD